MCNTVTAPAMTEIEVCFRLNNKEVLVTLPMLIPPKFWYRPHSCLGYLLQPLGFLYQLAGWIHQKISRPYRTDVPIISVGNLVMGGAGKTPVTLALASYLQKQGYTSHIVSRGYGGALSGPVRVDSSIHSYQDVGDEPLLLAQVAPTWVAKNRREGVKKAVQEGATVILLDDGHQNHRVVKDVRFVVVDTQQGFGNGQVFPAGPLRQSLKRGLAEASAIILIGPEDARPPMCNCPIIRATLEPLAPTPCPVVAFTGIGYPDKFRKTLQESRYEIKDFIPFPDHHPYTTEDLQLLRTKAEQAKARLITTEKDWVRLDPYHRVGILTLLIQIVFRDQESLDCVIKDIF